MLLFCKLIHFSFSFALFIIVIQYFVIFHETHSLLRCCHVSHNDNLTTEKFISDVRTYEACSSYLNIFTVLYFLLYFYMNTDLVYIDHKYLNA